MTTNPQLSLTHPPIVARRMFQVIVEVEVVVFEMPHTPPETELFNRIAYEGDGVQELLAAENALMSELWQNPKYLQVWLAYHSACTIGLEDHVFGDCREGDALLDPVIEKLPAEQQTILGLSTKEALYHAVQAHVLNARVEEDVCVQARD